MIGEHAPIVQGILITGRHRKNTETPPNDDGEAIPHDKPDEQPEADET